MKILITGSAGFIGQNAVKHFSAGNYVEGFDISTSLYYDRKLFNVDYIAGFDWVIHLGAISDTTSTDANSIYQYNIDCTKRLIETCIKAKTDIQYASSASVYGITESPSLETDRLNPLNLYALSKAVVDDWVLWVLDKTDCDIVIQGLRFFNVFGPGEDHKGKQASPHHQFTKQARDTGQINIFEGSHDFRRDFIHVDDVLNIQARLMQHRTSGIFNVGTGSTQSFAEVAEHVAKIYRASINIIPFPEHLEGKYQAYTCADMTKTNNTIRNIGARIANL